MQERALCTSSKVEALHKVREIAVRFRAVAASLAPCRCGDAVAVATTVDRVDGRAWARESLARSVATPWRDRAPAPGTATRARASEVWLAILGEERSEVDPPD